MSPRTSRTAVRATGSLETTSSEVEKGPDEKTAVRVLDETRLKFTDACSVIVRRCAVNSCELFGTQWE